MPWLFILNLVKVLVTHRVWLFVTPWTVARQAPLSMEFSRQEYWSGLPFSSPGDLPDPGTESMSPASPALAGKFFPGLPPGKPSQFGIKVMYRFPLFLASFVESGHSCWFFCSIQYFECVLLSCLSCWSSMEDHKVGHRPRPYQPDFQPQGLSLWFSPMNP